MLQLSGDATHANYLTFANHYDDVLTFNLLEETPKLLLPVGPSGSAQHQLRFVDRLRSADLRTVSLSTEFRLFVSWLECVRGGVWP